MSVKLFGFCISNQVTKETTTFLGQGETIKEAFEDGIKTVQTTFRPKNDGKSRAEHGLMVQAQGGPVKRTFAEFESDIPYKKSPQPTEPEEMDFAP